MRRVERTGRACGAGRASNACQIQTQHQRLALDALDNKAYDAYYGSTTPQ